MSHPLKKVIFYCIYKNGDIHSNKSIVAHFMEQLIDHGIEVAYFTNTQKHHSVNLDCPKGFVSESYPFLLNNPGTTLIEDTLFINTWVGHLGVSHTGLNHNISQQLPGWHDLAKLIHNITNGEIEIVLHNDNIMYAPEIMYNLLGPLPSSLPDNKKVLICNNIAESGQSDNKDLADAINRLCEKHKEVIFYYTNPIPINHHNLICTDDIFDRNINGSNLPEIGWLSEHCDIIVSNVSGPGAYAMTRKNFLDPHKIIITFLTSEEQAYYYGLDGVKCKTIYSNQCGDESVFNILDSVLSGTY